MRPLARQAAAGADLLAQLSSTSSTSPSSPPGAPATSQFTGQRQARDSPHPVQADGRPRRPGSGRPDAVPDLASPPRETAEISPGDRRIIAMSPAPISRSLARTWLVPTLLAAIEVLSLGYQSRRSATRTRRPVTAGSEDGTLPELDVPPWRFSAALRRPASDLSSSGRLMAPRSPRLRTAARRYGIDSAASSRDDRLLRVRRPCRDERARTEFDGSSRAHWSTSSRRTHVSSNRNGADSRRTPWSRFYPFPSASRRRGTPRVTHALESSARSRAARPLACPTRWERIRARRSSSKRTPWSARILSR